jgi:hypothetical protein
VKGVRSHDGLRSSLPNVNRDVSDFLDWLDMMDADDEVMELRRALTGISWSGEEGGADAESRVGDDREGRTAGVASLISVAGCSSLGTCEDVEASVLTMGEGSTATKVEVAGTVNVEDKHAVTL